MNVDLSVLVFVLVLGAATYRAARLVAVDGISEPLRAWVDQWAWDEEGGDDSTGAPRGKVRPWLAELINCPFCVGVWLGAGLIGVWQCWEWGRWGVILLAVTGVQAFLQSRPEPEE